MGVDGGAGNAISLSEVQTFYGGSNPISMSEYYRNGSLVPGDLVAAQSNTSGSSSQTIGQFGVTVTPAFGSVNDSGNRSTGVGGGGVSPYTVVSNDASITCSGGGGNNDGTAAVEVRVTRSGSTLLDASRSAGGTQAVGVVFKGPAHDGSGINFSGAESTVLQVGDIVTILSYTGENPSFGAIATSRRAGIFDVAFQNNNATTITTTSGSTGGAQSYTQNQSRTVIDDASSASYTLGYDAVNGNTNVPTSGSINMNVFNAPGSAAP